MTYLWGGSKSPSLNIYEFLPFFIFASNMGSVAQDSQFFDIPYFLFNQMSDP